MKSEWEIVSLGKYITHKKGYAFKSSQYKAFGTPIVKVTNLTEDSINMNDVVYTDDETASANKSVALFTGDSIVTTVGSWATNPASVVGKTVKVPNEAIGALLNQNAVIIRPLDDNIDKSFLYYVLKNDSFGKYLVSGAQGSASQASITLNDIYSYETVIPSIPTQKKIAHILSTLDDKIELNRKMNQTLEEMAQALFKSWFVDFDPVHVKAKCSSDEELDAAAKELGISKEILDLFPSEFEESELGMIPKGWEIKSLNDVTSKFATGLNPRKNFVLGEGTNYYVTIKNMGNQDVILDDKCDKVTDEALVKINRRSDLRKGDFLFSGIGTIGRVFYLHETPINWNISESVFTIRANTKHLTEELLYLTLLGHRLQSYAHQLASGSVQKGIRMGDLKSYEIVIPDIKTQQILSKFLAPLIAKGKANSHEIRTLQKTRDTLLPKLLSGEIDVSELDMKV